MLAPGLPNITGSFGGYAYYNMLDSGAFSNNGDLSGFESNTISKAWHDRIEIFDASRSSAIYGASSTVQPPAIALLWQLKL